MPVERSAGMIVFRNTPHGRRYLIIRSSRNASYIAKWKNIPEFWDLPKGILEKGEKGIDAALREAEEEAGISRQKLRLVEGFKKTVRYFTRRDGKTVLKFVALFLAESKTAKVQLSWEHDIFVWLPYGDARRKLSLPQMREAVIAAEAFLKTHDRI